MSPDFLIIGAPKCGTTSLAASLNEHPRVFIPAVKEIGFFSRDDHWNLGLEWYESHFPEQPEQGVLCGEATPFYLSAPQAPARIAATVPRVKLIALLRNPLSRAHSHFWFRKRAGTEHRSFQEAIREEIQNPTSPENYLIPVGYYARQLKAYREKFDENQLLVLLLEDFKHSEKEQLEKIYRLLEIESADLRLLQKNAAKEAVSPVYQDKLRQLAKGQSPLKTLVNTVVHKSTRKRVYRWMQNLNRRKSEKPPFETAEKNLLKEVYQSEIKTLEELLSRDLNHWLEI